MKGKNVKQPKRDQKNYRKFHTGESFGTALIFLAIAVVINLIGLFFLFDLSEEASNFKTFFSHTFIIFIPLLVLPVIIGYKAAKKYPLENLNQAGLIGLIYGVGLAIIFWLIDITSIIAFLSFPIVIGVSLILSVSANFISKTIFNNKNLNN